MPIGLVRVYLDHWWHDDDVVSLKKRSATCWKICVSGAHHVFVYKITENDTMNFFSNRCDHAAYHTHSHTNHKNLYVLYTRKIIYEMRLKILVRVMLLNTLFEMTQTFVLSEWFFSSSARKYHKFNLYLIENDANLYYRNGRKFEPKQADESFFSSFICYYFDWSIMYYLFLFFKCVGAEVFLFFLIQFNFGASKYFL